MREVEGMLLYHVMHVHLFCVCKWTPISFSITYRNTNIDPCRCEPRSRQAKKTQKTNKKPTNSSLNPLCPFSLWQILQEEGTELICQPGSLTWETSSLSLLNQVQAQNRNGVLCIPHNVDIVGQLNLPHNWRPLLLIFCGKCFDKQEFFSKILNNHQISISCRKWPLAGSDWK